MHAPARRRSSILYTVSFIKPHDRQNVEQTPCDKPPRRNSRYTVCATLWPSHYHTHARDKRRMDLRPGANQKKNCGPAPATLLKQSGVLGSGPLLSGAASERRRCIEHRTGQDRQKLQQCAQTANKRCTLNVQNPAQHNPHTDLTDTQAFLNVPKLHVSIGLLDHCSVLYGVSLLLDANTMGTFSDEYPVADLDMFVLATTKRITSISSLPAPTPTKNTFPKMAKPTPS